MSSEPKTTEQLILAYLTHGLSIEQQQQLATTLQQSAQARELLASHLRVEAGVLRLARGQALSTPSRSAISCALIAVPTSGCT